MTATPPRGIVGVVRAADARVALVIAEGMALGGVDAVEVTFTVPDADSVIAAMRDRSAVLVGAGTVRTVESCRRAADAGAQFVVAPDLDPAVVDLAHELGMPAIPGALTPNEIGRCLSVGADTIKLFPIGAVGGARYLRTISEPFPNVSWMVSGGIAGPEVAGYRAAGAGAVCLGSALIDHEAARRGDVEAVAGKTSGVVCGVRHGW